MNRIFYSAMGRLLAATLAVAAFSPIAHATVYITGSVSDSSSNLSTQTYQSVAASGSLAVDMGRYMRIGITHKQEQQKSEGYKDIAEEGQPAQYVPVTSRTQITSNSLDLTLILYEGAVMMPYLNIGAIVKNYNISEIQAGVEKRVTGVSGPMPNLGLGVGIRLNKDFTLKISHLVSPGESDDPFDDKEARTVLDRSTSVGLTYQF